MNWSEKIYKQVSAQNWDQCHGICYLDSGPCYLFSFSSLHGTCSLGDWNSKTTKYSLAPNSIVYQHNGEYVLEVRDRKSFWPELKT